jgi:hypothetical protein
MLDLHVSRRPYFAFALILLSTLSEQAWAANCNATYTYTDNGGSSNYTLNAGQALKIASGTYSGTVEFGSGSTVCVETGATFTGSLNNPAGTFTNYGTTTLNGGAFNAGTVLDNYGTFTFAGNPNTNGAVTVNNRTNATLSAPTFQLGSNSTFTNDGLFTATGDLNTTLGTTLTNNYRIEVNGNFNPDGTFTNNGRAYAKKFINMNSDATIINNCTFVSYDGFNSNNPNVTNNGTILITQPNNKWQHNGSGVFRNGPNAKVAGYDFINNATVTGSGAMIFSGSTTNQGAFTGTSSSNQINFYDETQTGAQIFDAQNTAPTNTVRTAFTRPTELDAPNTCTNTYKAFAMPPVTSDYGDAPATYGDAEHDIVSGIHLGTLPPDAENASQYSFNAAADGAEDDGAPHPVLPSGPATATRFPVLKLTDTSYSSAFTVTNTTAAAGKLIGWIDFDKSGTFEADESATVAVPTGASNSTVTLTWNSIPTDIKLGTTFIRLRLSTDTTVTTTTPTGVASDGEVEDYPIAIYQPVPANSPNLSIVTGITPTACTATVFTDNFNDVGYISWGANAPVNSDIRNWVRAGGGTDTYADVEDKGAPQGMAVYFGNGTIRGISPSIPNGYTFDANGKLTTPINAIALRDVPDDTGVSHWGPEPVTLSTSVPTVIGKAYRLYFKAIPETDAKEVFVAGIMRVDIKGATTESIHFKAPGSLEPNQDYAIEFTATAATSTITFVNYGHADDQWCDTQTTDWCTEGGLNNNTSPNELIVDDVVVAARENCEFTDYGDAPATYGTPYHNIVAGMQLGALAPDRETAAQSNAAANGDNILGTDDEDGITFPVLTQGKTVIVNAKVAGAGGYLQGWIDFNGDGDFADAGEQIATDVQDKGAGDSTPAVGTIGISVTVPETAVTTQTYARFRWSSMTALNSTAPAPDGEVEDYALTIAAAQCSLVVTTTADSNSVNNNSGSLRDAIECANSGTGKLISFNMPTTEAGYSATTKAWTIKPLTPLPALTGNNTYIDASSQADAMCGDLTLGTRSLLKVLTVPRTLRVQIDGTGLPASTNGLLIEGDNIAVRGLAITHFPAAGISLKNGADNALLACNHLGVTADGNTAGGNTIGIDVAGSRALIGGSSSSEGNLIAYNTQQGVALQSTAQQVMLTRNPTYANGKLGIDLGINGVTVNDANDADSGANQLLNMPILNQVIVDGSELTIRGCASAGATVELFEADVSSGGTATTGANQFGLSRDYGEGQRYLTSFAENSAGDIDSGPCDLPAFDGHDNTGMEAFQFTLTLPKGVVAGDKLTATSTLATAGTSEFSPSIAAEGAPPSVGGGSCGATGGTDILFIVDNSGSITPAEYADFSNTIKNVGASLLADNPANRIGVAHFGGPATSLVSGGQYVYFERDFSSTAMNAPVRKFGTSGTYNVNWWADHLAGAVQQIRYAIDGNTGTTSSYIVSPLKEMARNTASPLQIVLMTDAVRYANFVPSDISMLIDPSGSGAEPNDGSDYTVYNQLKASGITFSVVSFNPNPVDIAASAAIASVGGTYTGTIDANPKDPEGSGKSPRRYIAVTSGFQLTTAQIDTVVEGTALCSSAVSGFVFEDIHYGGGAGRSPNEAGTVGVNAATVEFYNKTGGYVASTPTDATGRYKLPNLVDDTYYVRVVSDSVSSTRSGSNGSEVPVPTYPSLGGTTLSARDAGINTGGTSSLNITNFTFSGGALNGQQAQAVQQIVLNGDSLQHVDFGFNFSTVVNANDSGQGSLRQFLLNANLLGDDATLLQQAPLLKPALPAGKENAIFQLATTDPNYVAGVWKIKLLSPLPTIHDPVVLDGTKQAGFIQQPVLVLEGSGASIGDGLTLHDGSAGSSIQAFAINGFKGAGLRLAYTADNMIGGANNGQGNVISANGGAGIALDATAGSNNTLLGNSIHSNGGLGIDLKDDGITANDVKDTDTGVNDLLNYPDVQAAAFATNGSKIIAYDFVLDLPTNANGYRLEFFKNTAKDPSGNGEGQVFLGSKDFTHPGTGALQFKGSFNANQAVATSDFIAITVTAKRSPTRFGSTSEFSGVANNNTAQVCTSLINNPTAALPDMMIDENLTTPISYLSTKDSSGNPVTYVISGGADGAMFTVGPVTNGTLDCAQIKFMQTVATKSITAETRGIVAGIPEPGNFEVPMDKDRNNVYDIEITATDSAGKKYVRTLSVRVMNVNEAPVILSAATASVEEDGVMQALDIQAQDQDSTDTEGNGLLYSVSGGADQDKFSLNASNGVLSFKTIPDYDAPIDSNRDNVYEVSVTVTDQGGLSASKTFSITVLNRVADDGVKVQARVFLQGAYDSKTGLMAADLNTLGVLPVKQPYQSAPFNYAGTETLGALLKANTGNNAVVDWVLLELRSSPTTIISSRAVMLLRNGNLVDAQTGATTLHFANVKPGNYYVSVRHRNHLGVISASPLSLSSTEKLVDFTLSTTGVKGTDARFVSGALALLWAGDINSSATLTSSGPGNDITNLLSSVITHQDNPQAYTNFTLRGYLNTDLNMDGKTLFTGPNNDANALMGNVIMHPQNSNFAANYIVHGGLQ